MWQWPFLLFFVPVPSTFIIGSLSFLSLRCIYEFIAYSHTRLNLFCNTFVIGATFILLPINNLSFFFIAHPPLHSFLYSMYIEEPLFLYSNKWFCFSCLWWEIFALASSLLIIEKKLSFCLFAFASCPLNYDKSPNFMLLLIFAFLSYGKFVF